MFNTHGARNRWANSGNGWQQGVSGLLALPLQLVLDQRDDPHRMEECNRTHTNKNSKGCVQDGRVSRNILNTSSIQSDVSDHLREVDTGG